MMKGILDNLIDRIKKDYRVNFKNKLLINLSMYGIVFYTFFSISFLIIGFVPGTLLMLIGAILQFVFIQLFIGKKIPYKLTFNLGISTTFLILLIDIYFSGGIKSHSFPWLLIIPVLSNLILENRRSNIFWLSISILGAFIFSYHSFLGFKVVNKVPEQFLTYVNFSSYTGFAVMLLLLTSLFDKKKNHFYKEFLIKEFQLKENIELKKTKDSLKENQERWKFAIEGSNDGMWDYNYESGEVYRSTRWAELLGFKKEEISNSIEEWKDRIHPDDIERVEELLYKHFKKETESYVSEHRVLCKDGSYKWVLDRGKVIAWTENGKPKRVVGTKTDITKRKLAEEELRQSEGKLQAIFKGSNDAILLLTEKGFFDCNPKALEMFKIPSKESIKNIHPVDISPEFQQDGRNSLDKANEMIKIAFEKGVNRFEWCHKRLNGETFPAEVLLSAFYYGDELVLQSTVQDITDRKATNERIKQSEEKYRSLVENSPEIILITDENQNIEFFNLASKRYEQEEIIGDSLFNYVDQNHHKEIDAANKRILRGEVKYESYETEGTDIDGNKQYFQTHVGPKYNDDKVIGLVLFIRNITDRKISEDKIKQSLAEKEVLLKEVHHRVKNNLQIISSILNLQSSTISDTSTLELLKNSQDRIRSMSLIHELLYQTKDFSTIQFSEYIKSIATNLFHSYNQNRNIVLEQDLDDIKLDLDMAIPCGLIVNELITNALKYAFDEKEEGVVKIGLKQESELIKLSISDDGKGFPENINFRETSSLGMQLVISLVEQIDGEILLNSEKGTQYTITFNAPF